MYYAFIISSKPALKMFSIFLIISFLFFLCSAFFSFHMYLIQQGRTTNETFKWAALLSSDRKVLAGHQQYSSLDQPDCTHKVESMTIIEDDCSYGTGENACDKHSERYHGDDIVNRSDALTNVTGRKDPVCEKLNECLGAYVGPSPSQHADSIQTSRADVAIIGSDGGRNLEGEEQMWDRDLGTGTGTDCRQRSDSTSDGAPSAVIELCRSSEKRKIGSSSSGSTSSSKRYCYCDVSDDDEDYILAEGSDEDGDIVYLESHCPSMSKSAALGIKENSSERHNRATAATVAIIEAEALLEAEELTVGCIPASTAMLDPFIEKALCPSCPSKVTGVIPDNLYKTDLLSAFRNVFVPPSTGKLKALHERQVAVTALGSAAGEMHND